MLGSGWWRLMAIGVMSDDDDDGDDGDADADSDESADRSQ